ncbi:type II CRISPR RNA-guided endonuclease Cas9 [Helicobacter sp. 11S02596-1]|nr:type II CRISPR RNA-guided endonuclease Cas9 [Helicobacter sp. 11S02596-1]
MKILGIDIGITSIGWALVEADRDLRENNKIIDCGVRLFTQAENPKNGESLALPRREARSMRRIIKRRKARMSQIKKLLCKHFGFAFEVFVSDIPSLPKLFATHKAFLSPWELRALGLERKLSDTEFARVLLHIAKRRGYNDLSTIVDDNHASDKAKKEKVILNSIKENKKQMETKGYKTIGEMMFKEYYGKEISQGCYENVRNKGKQEESHQQGAKENYKRSIGRRELQNEIEEIFKSQREFGNQKAHKGFEDDFKKIAFSQRELKSFESKVGNCEFFPEEKRASKCCYSAEEFINLTKIINTLKNIEHISGEIYPKEIIKEILDRSKRLKGGLSYQKLREILKLDEKIEFKDVKLDYINDKKPEDKIFIKFQKYHELKDYLRDFEAEFTSWGADILDNIAQIITFNKSSKILSEKISKLPISKPLQEKLINNSLGFSTTIRLSLKALDRILPYMREGKRYDEAILLAGLKKDSPTNNKCSLLPPLSETGFADTLNPVVNRAMAQYRKVINAIIKKYGKVHKIHLEFTRDIGRNFKERSRIFKEQQENYRRNQDALEICKTYGLDETQKNILKVKLWICQDEFCVYSGKKITKECLRDANMLEIDHIYPLSRSLDDSQGNKVLVFATQNQAKGDRTPYEWLGNDTEKWDEFEKRIRTMKKLPRNVKKKLFNKNFAGKHIGDRASFLARNLNDTGYINRLISQYTASYLEFLPLSDIEDMSKKAGAKGSKKHILTLNGGLTSLLRHYWGLEAKNRDTHLHHAQDAIIIAFATDGNIQAFSTYLQTREQAYLEMSKKAKNIQERGDNKTKKSLQKPLENFATQVGEKINNIFVSKAPRRNVTGALHEQTIYPKEKYLDVYGGAEGVEKALKLGKIRQIHQGIVANGEMVRADIFKSKDKGKFYVVPIYTYDVAIGRLPNKAIVQGKDKKTGVIKDWIEMDTNYTFCFSLFKDDLVQIQTNKMSKSLYAYYAATNASTSGMTFRHHSNKILEENEKEFFKEKPNSGFLADGCGIQNFKIFKKCIISPLGEICEARWEPRKDVRLKTTKKKP